jgi:putative N6-adenine-specific DNA methylase
MSLSESTFAFFASCAPGIEDILAGELGELGLVVRATPGGVEGRGSLAALQSILHKSRIAESLRVRLRSFRATDFATLQRELARLPWHAYLASGAGVEVSVTCHKSRLYHSDAVKERVLAAIARKLESAKPGLPTPAPPRIYVRLDHDVVQVSVGASGERLHKRGYRTHVVDAPLRETLAAAIARVGRVGTSNVRVWDPFAGSGTLGLEWLGIALGLPARREHYAMDEWPICRNRSAEPKGAVPLQAETGLTPVSSVASAWLTDIDPRAIAASRHNAEAAGLLERCEFRQMDFEQALSEIPSDTTVLANPPYGVRLDSTGAAAKLIARFERALAQRTDLRPALLVCPEPLMRGTRRIPWQPIARFPNGGVPVTLFRVG